MDHQDQPADQGDPFVIDTRGDLPVGHQRPGAAAVAAVEPQPADPRLRAQDTLGLQEPAATQAPQPPQTQRGEPAASQAPQPMQPVGLEPQPPVALAVDPEQHAQALRLSEDRLVGLENQVAAIANYLISRIQAGQSVDDLVAQPQTPAPQLDGTAANAATSPAASDASVQQRPGTRRGDHLVRPELGSSGASESSESGDRASEDSPSPAQSRTEGRMPPRDT